MKLPLPPPSDPYLAGIQARTEQRQLPLPPPQQPYVSPWRLRKEGFDSLHFMFTGGTCGIMLTRHEVFRLIGELERIGATL